MWNRLQTAANTTTTTLTQTQMPSELLPHHNPKSYMRRQRRDPSADIHAGPLDPDPDPDKRFWQESFDNRLNGLDIPGDVPSPYKYEIHRGKTVPSPSGTPLGSNDHLPALGLGVKNNTKTTAPPPRNPARLRVQDTSKSTWRPASSIYPDDDNSNGNDNASSAVYGRHGHLKSDSQFLSPTDNMYTYGHRPAYAHGGEQVSPPSSPDIKAMRAGHMDHDVSPIDDEADVSHQQLLKGARPTQSTPRAMQQSRATPSPSHAQQSSGAQSKSNIPMMRRERRKQQSAAAASKPGGRPSSRQAGPVQGTSPRIKADWEDPTMAERGRPTDGAAQDDAPMYGSTTVITSQTGRRSKDPSPSLGQRMRQFGKGKPEPLDQRPAWNGASGRQTLVNPVRDDTNVAPLSVPPKNKKRDERTKSPTNDETSTGSSAAAAMRRFMPLRSKATPEHHGRSSPAPEPATHNAAASPHPHPSSAHTESPNPQHHQTAPQSNTASPIPPRLTIPSTEKAIKRKPPPSAQANAASHAVHPSTSSSIYSSQPDALGLSVPAPGTSTTVPKVNAPEETWVQPASRFSISTCATSAADSSHPSHEEDQPPVPELPQAASVMGRRRPVHGSNSPQTSQDEPIVISLKSAYKHNAAGQEQHRRDMSFDAKDGRPSSVCSTNKALPLAPPEMVDTKDRVVVLNAKLDGLAHRRNNINKSIKQMTELMPADKLLESVEVMRKREEEKKKVELLREELAEIQQQEYDLGLKLHRAYKRQEREADYESGSLWVRRVTS